MFDLEIFEAINIHQETLCREACLNQALRQAGLTNPPLMDRALPRLGDTLINIGLKLKERSHARMTTEQAPVPSFLIML